MMLVHFTITLFNYTTILCNTGIYGDRGPRAEYYWLISVAKLQQNVFVSISDNWGNTTVE